MKKLLSILLFALVSISSYAQSNLFLRASTVTLGFRYEQGAEISWGETKPVNVLIKITQTTATVFSQTTQEYHLVSLLKKTDNGTSYRCTDSEGKLCNLLVMPVSDSPGYLFFIVEYSDSVWYYKCKTD